MNKKVTIRTSKFLSLVLRHKPEEANLTLTADGWCSVPALLVGLASKGVAITRDDLKQVVEENDKKRFELSADGSRIRAVQGHSIAVDLQYPPSAPPETLYHGTATRFLDSIKQQGLIAGNRQHVHLSATLETAVTVGARHGKPVVIPVASGALHRAGTPFYLAPNGVWLVEGVPKEYLDFRALIL